MKNLSRAALALAFLPLVAFTQAPAPQPITFQIKLFKVDGQGKWDIKGQSMKMLADGTILVAGGVTERTVKSFEAMGKNGALITDSTIRTLLGSPASMKTQYDETTQSSVELVPTSFHKDGAVDFRLNFENIGKDGKKVQYLNGLETKAKESSPVLILWNGTKAKQPSWALLITAYPG